MTYQTPAPRYARPIPASNLPPLERPRPPRRFLRYIGGGLAVLLLAGCGITDTRSNAERSYDECVQRGMEPTSCAIGSEQVYRLPPRKGQ